MTDKPKTSTEILVRCHNDCCCMSCLLIEARKERDQYKDRVEDLELQVSMSCEDPPDDCECPGCKNAFNHRIGKIR